MATFDPSVVDETSMNAFVRRTTEVAPSLSPVLAEHIADYDEILAHVYFGDLSRWIVTAVGSSPPSREATGLLDLFESTYPNADSNVRELIDVSFVENVQDDPAVVALFGPTLLSRVEPEYRPRQAGGNSWD